MKRLLAKLYGLAAGLRVRLYSAGLLKTRRLNSPVVSVGNLTVGGTGKTPYVAYLARVIQESGRQPAILSRGYRGKAERSTLLVSDGGPVRCRPEDCGDEPCLLARKLPGVFVAVGKDRYAGGRLVEERFGDVIHILDDGFQHVQLERDLNILLLDATDPFGGGQPLPAGRLREPLRALARADLIVVTRAHLPMDGELIETQVRRWNPRAPISYFHHDAVGLYDLKSGERHRLRDWIGQPAAALAAIGKPEVFLHDLAHYQIRVVGEFLHRDHHAFTQRDLDEALALTTDGSARAVVTTEKDAVKLERLEFSQGQVMVFEIEAMPEDEPEYRRFILEEIRAL